jgi:hypothetical protein
LHTVCLGCLQTTILLISACCVVRIVGVSYQNLWFWPINYTSGCPKLPPWGLISRLEKLTELREMLTYFYQFIIKYILKDAHEQPNEELHRVGSGRILAYRVPFLWSWGRLLSPNVDELTFQKVLSSGLLGVYEGCIASIWLIKSLASDDQLNFQPEVGSRAEFQLCEHRVDFSIYQSPSSRNLEVARHQSIH